MACFHFSAMSQKYEHLVALFEVFSHTGYAEDLVLLECDVFLSVGFTRFWINEVSSNICSNNNNIYYLQLGCHPVAVVILHVQKY
jgi:hypothetical protein